MERAINVAKYIISTGATVRITATKFNISKSTVHKDVAERLSEIDKQLYLDVRKILDVNLKERHIRGGIATQKKYEHNSQ